jgi:hypothetical protein
MDHSPIFKFNTFANGWHWPVSKLPEFLQDESTTKAPTLKMPSLRRRQSRTAE